MENDTVLTLINGKAGINKVRSTIDLLTREFDDRVELNKVLARLQKQKYDDLIAVGFTPEQALQLAKEF